MHPIEAVYDHRVNHCREDPWQEISRFHLNDHDDNDDQHDDDDDEDDHHLINSDEEVFRRPDPEHAEVGEHHQVEEGQLQEVGEAE